MADEIPTVGSRLPPVPPSTPTDGHRHVRGHFEENVLRKGRDRNREAQRLRMEERTRQILHLRITGAPCSRIAVAVRLSERRVRQLLNAELSKEAQANAVNGDRLRELEDRRLDYMIAKVMQRLNQGENEQDKAKGVQPLPTDKFCKMLDRLTKLLDRKAKLHGLYMR